MNYLTDIENACIAKILSAYRSPLTDPPRSIVNKCDVFRGEKDEIFMAIIREVAPAVWLRLDRSLNKAIEFEQASSTGQPYTVATLQNRLTLTWSFFVCSQSLRSTKELSQGGPGVIGAYELLQMLVGSPAAMPDPPAASPAQLKDWAPVSYAEPFILVGWELLGQTTTAAVYELQLRTRVQL